MSAPSSAHSRQLVLHLYATATYDCSYLEAHEARSQVVIPGKEIDTEVYAQLIEKGFRRSGQTIYRPWCDHCSACIPLRIPADAFHPDRSQRRAWKHHGTLAATVLPLHFSEEHYALYRRYQHARHAGGSMDVDDPQEYRDFILASPVHSVLVEFREGDILRMVALVDVLPRALSAVYTFYDDIPHAAYGTYAVLWQIAHARATGKAHVYLGYWIEECRKMSYKTRFQPCEILRESSWERAMLHSQ